VVFGIPVSVDPGTGLGDEVKRGTVAISLLKSIPADREVCKTLSGLAWEPKPSDSYKTKSENHVGVEGAASDDSSISLPIESIPKYKD
jgi:hypothetical protein